MSRANPYSLRFLSHGQRGQWAFVGEYFRYVAAYLKAKIVELETNSKIKNNRDLCRGMIDFKKGYLPRTNIVMDERGDLVTNSRSVLAGWRNHFSQLFNVHSVQQKSSGLIFRTSRSGSDVRCYCHHNSSRSTFPIFVYSWRFSSFHSLQSITPHIY